jgi:hypothetical protein
MDQLCELEKSWEEREKSWEEKLAKAKANLGTIIESPFEDEEEKEIEVVNKSD